MPTEINLPRIDTSQPGAADEIAALRQELSLEGNVVSEAGRQKTIDVFGKPLSPVQVVERICEDVRRRGLDAVLDYTARLDGADIFDCGVPDRECDEREDG